MKVSVILPAAGLGTRMGKTQPEKAGTSRKQFMLLDDQPILVHTVRKFLLSPVITEIVIAVRADDMQWASQLLSSQTLKDNPKATAIRIVEGGDSRQSSVENALASLAPDTDLVAVHDAVRPFVDLETIEKVVHEAAATGAAIVGIVPVDTVKLAHLNKVRQTLLRERLILTQTPQVFRYGLLKDAFAKAREDGFTGTDESSLVERLERIEVSVVLGSERNIKITRPTDMALAHLFHSMEVRERKAS